MWSDYRLWRRQKADFDSPFLRSPGAADLASPSPSVLVWKMVNSCAFPSYLGRQII